MIQKPDFFRTLGEAIAAWQHLEEQLRELLILLLSPAPKKAINAAFFAARHFETKLRIVDAVIATTDLEELKEQWTTIHNSVSKKAKSRHRLAHGMAVLHVKNEIVTLPDGSEAWESEMKLQDLRDSERPPFTEPQIRQIERGFVTASFDVMKLCDFVEQHASSLYKPHKLKLDESSPPQ